MTFSVWPAYADENTPDFDILCKYLDKQKPDKTTVGADYVPGMDVHGNKVVSADVESGNKAFIHDPVIIPIQLDLLKQSGISLPSTVFSEAVLGEIKIYSDGRFVLGEEDISQPVKSFCHGQKVPDPLPSSNKTNP